MQAQDPPNLFAWQPLTPRGVAAFAYASWRRLLAVQFCFALLAALTVIWVLHETWFPAVLQGIRALPNEGEVRGGTLRFPGDNPVRLAENRFLSVAVDLEHAGQARSPSHVQVEFGARDVRFLSLFGFAAFKYPAGYIIAFNRGKLEPWWGAWSPAILAAVTALVVGGLLISWIGLATVYFLPLWVAGFFANRDLNLGGSWRLAGAALMPGALLLTTALFFYGLGAVDPLRLLVAGGVHLVVGWFYALVSTFKLRPHPAVLPRGKNPFEISSQRQGEEAKG